MDVSSNSVNVNADVHHRDGSATSGYWSGQGRKGGGSSSSRKPSTADEMEADFEEDSRVPMSVSPAKVTHGEDDLDHIEAVSVLGSQVEDEDEVEDAIETIVEQEVEAMNKSSKLESVRAKKYEAKEADVPLDDSLDFT